MLYITVCTHFLSDGDSWNELFPLFSNYQTNPDTWETHAQFLAAGRRLKGLKVVNNTAERGVALIQAFNKTLTRDEDQLQFLLQVVSEHRRLFPSTNKNALVATSQPQQFYD
jgi:hypothetical protein